MSEPVFAIVIPSYNNEKWVAKCLQSCLSQRYPHWSLIYIDDASTDNTASLVVQHAPNCTLIHNSQRKGKLANLYEVVQALDPRVIVVELDGDDWLANDRVLDTLAAIYKDPDVWLTYGGIRNSRTRSHGCALPIPQHVVERNAFREAPWFGDHLRSFYAGLFQRIRKRDLMCGGEFFSMSSDMAFMLPMLEMSSQGHFRYIKRPLYIYNAGNPASDRRTNPALQSYLDKYIRSLPKYPPLEELPHRAP